MKTTHLHNARLPRPPPLLLVGNHSRVGMFNWIQLLSCHSKRARAKATNNRQGVFVPNWIYPCRTVAIGRNTGQLGGFVFHPSPHYLRARVQTLVDYRSQRVPVSISAVLGSKAMDESLKGFQTQPSPEFPTQKQPNVIR